MVAQFRRYAVTMPGVPGTHAPPEVVVVHLTDRVAPGGGLVYEDAGGGVRVQISGEVAQLLDADPGQHPCLRADPLP